MATVKKELVAGRKKSIERNMDIQGIRKMNKTKARVPQIEWDGYADGHPVPDLFICPTCGTEYEYESEHWYRFCPMCGQKFDWEIEIPDDCRTYETDMDQIVSCPQCGKKIKFGDGYSSQEIHTVHGFGYAVCEECHTKEMKRRFAEE